MATYKSKNIKTQSSEIFLGIFFIIIVLIIIFVFTQMHTIFLYSNHNINQEKNQINLLLNLREKLVLCYNYPLEINHDNCEGIENLDFKIETIDNGLCKNQTIYQLGETKSKEKTIFIPIKDMQKDYICPGRIILYSDINKK